MEFTVLGCRVKVDYLFVLMLCVSALFSAYDWLLVLLFSFLHEFGHLIALVLLGGKAKSLTFSYYGFALKYDTQFPNYKEIIVLTAGPLVNLIFYLILKDTVNLVLLFVNLLPIYPLDFGRILCLFSFKISKIVGYIFIVLMGFLSIYILLYYDSFSLLLIVIYLLFFTINY